MNRLSRIEIEVLVLSAAIVVMPLLVAVVYLVRRYCIRRRRPQVSFLEIAATFLGEPDFNCWPGRCPNLIAKRGRPRRRFQCGEFARGFTANVQSQ
jgi:hypothetical protein